MKTELLIILALAAALSWHRTESSSTCSSPECITLPVDLPDLVHAATPAR